MGALRRLSLGMCCIFLWTLAVPAARAQVASETVPEGALIEESLKGQSQLGPSQTEEPQTDESPPAEAPEPLSRRHADWLEEVGPLIKEAEREVFVGLTKEYQRDTFVQRFWRARDPFPRTSRNEFRDLWEANLEIARDLFGGTLEDPRAQMVLINGEPVSKIEPRCSDFLRPLEIWFYEGTPRIRGTFYLVFYRRGAGKDQPYKLWYPSEGLSPLLSAALTRTPSDQVALTTISERCLHGGRAVDAITSAIDWGELTSRADVLPDPGEEWLRTFVAYSTDLPEDAETFDATVELTFPGRFQSRTVVQGLVSVATDDAGISDLEAHPSYNFVVDGEILRKGELFEHFRYRFNLKAGQVLEGTLPLAFQRLLRPGTYQLELKVEDLNRTAFYRGSHTLEVPRVAATTVATTTADLAPVEAPDPFAKPTLSTRLLGEANADLPTGDHSLKLLAPQAALVTGRLRVEALTQGEDIAKVLFELNGKRVLSKSRPPFSVELNLGAEPRIHTVRAVALDDAGKTLASDEVLINAGPHRFSIRLIEPQAGKSYHQSVRAQAAVEVPEGERLDRVELFLNDTLVATLYQPPFVQPMLISNTEPLSFVRAVAYLRDGGIAEDAVFVNAPDYVDEVKVQFVELYTTVLARRGKPIDDLTKDEVEILEDDKPQTLLKMERVTDVPIHAGILLDVSNSMTTRLDEAVEGALRFFETVMTPKDRAAVITFNETPHLAVRFTSSLEVLAGGLAGLTAEGETSLHDSLIYALYYFSGISGKRAVILLSDGEDVRSTFTFEEVIAYARRTGVAVYTVGISLSGGKSDIRIKLQRLASETGGGCYFVDAGYQLAKVYEAIQEELRSQYVLSYQSDNEGDGFRRVEVKVNRPGVSAKTISGYYP